MVTISLSLSQDDHKLDLLGDDNVMIYGSLWRESNGYRGFYAWMPGKTKDW